MVSEGDQGQWLLAKARQLKERALGTADRTRRKQFLLIATEYQKLARQEDGAVALDIVERAIAAANNPTPRVHVVTMLHAGGRQAPAQSSDVPEGLPARLLRAFRRPEVFDMAIWAVLALIAFGLLLVPGDQTTQGLHEVFELLAD